MARSNAITASAMLVLMLKNESASVRSAGIGRRMVLVRSAGTWAQVMDWKDESSSFVPVILNSVSSSLQRSAQYNKMLASADGKLSGQTKDVKSVFHSTVG